MSSKRLHMILIGVICLLFLGLIGGAYGINSLLTSQADKLAGLKAKSQALAQEQTGLKTAKSSIAKYSDLEKIASTIVPEDKNQAEAVRQLVNIAAASNISLSSITFPASTLGNKVGSASSSSTSTTAPSAAAAAAGSKTSQLQPVKNIAGVYQLPITVASDVNRPVPYSKFINFLSALEHNRRTSQVSNIALQPTQANPNNLSFTLTINEYIKP